MHTALFDAIPDGLVIVDEAGRILMANRAAYRLFGYSFPDLIGRSVDLLVPADLRERHRRHRRGFRRSPRERAMGQAHMQLMGCRQDGSQFPVEIALNPLQLGERIQILASIRDISDTPIAQRVHRRTLHDAALASIGHRIVSSEDIDEALHHVASDLSDALGAGPVWALIRGGAGTGEHRGTGATAPPAAWLKAQGDPLFALLEGVPALDTRAVWLAGDMLPAGMQAGVAFPLLLPDGAVPAALTAFSRNASALDTDVVRLLQTAAAMLSSLLQRQRSSEALAHAQRLDAIGQLTGGVAHDFNNLLTVVSGNLQMLETYLEPGEPRELLAAAVRAVDQGAALTRKLLSFAGRQRLRPAIVSLARELGELERLARASLGDRVRLSMRIDPDVPAVRVDPSMLDSVILNLILNARDAIDGAGEVEISLREERPRGAHGPDSDRYVALAVRDTGCGMSPETLERAWEPFFTTKPTGRGTGLGLSMVYGFIRQSGGRVHLQSTPGKGTTVTLCLPAVMDDAADVLASQPAIVGGSEVVLVVEDDDAVRATTEGMLKSLGYHTIATASPRAALECIETLGDIALLFADLTLQDAMTGIELAREAQRARPDLAVLITSGYPDASATEQGDRFSLLGKPYHRDDLARAVRTALNEARLVPTP